MSFHERLVYVAKVPLLGRVANAVLRVLGVNIPSGVVVGRGLSLPHGAVGLVVHERTVLGDNVKLYQGVTLGRSDTHLAPDVTRPGGRILVGDDVVIGASATVLFRSGETLTIGDRAVVGANALVLRSVPAGEIWAGNPARRVATRE
ncbi:serine O-acetyltransferase [Cryobacterium sp. MP_M5]|uniref:serine O-acetyltransferase n=1 Tax=unclassified Cryobacterium TaxID=2649013 RepID=UPI0018C9E261|nr:MULTISPECIES: DapH/DapD/GlmU-related protein [unclassified Cryobacterium]MBG6057006.1 serine O-acetyltransferase [Cryobacterium sp. MP_M3]MEC5175205.1 serine O-acetyltransferase [Cryobacterium sp. MP_M5]